MWTFEEFVERVDHIVRQLRAKGIEQGFCERERVNRIDTFGNIAHVWSTYESRWGADDVEPFSRAINSFQLVRCDGRWWVVTIFWDAERPEKPIPAKYLGQALLKGDEVDCAAAQLQTYPFSRACSSLLRASLL